MLEVNNSKFFIKEVISQKVLVQDSLRTSGCLSENVK
jgi:hypothetical protein